MPDLQQFSEDFSKGGAKGTRFAAALAGQLRREGLTGKDVDIQITQDPNGGIGSLVVGAKSDDPLVQLQVADAALTALEKQGVDVSGISGLDPTIDPLAWNVVYKDGGWVVNG